MKKKKGFTLIELLAIIVILAIIAVITVPIILGIIDDSKAKASVASAYGFKDAVEKDYATKLLANNEQKLNGTYTITNGRLGNIDLPISGTKPSNGSLVYQNNKLISGCLTIDGYRVEYQNDKFTATKGDCNETSTVYYTYDPNATESENGYITNKQSSIDPSWEIYVKETTLSNSGYTLFYKEIIDDTQYNTYNECITANENLDEPSFVTLECIKPYVIKYIENEQTMYSMPILNSQKCDSLLNLDSPETIAQMQAQCEEAQFYVITASEYSADDTLDIYSFFDTLESCETYKSELATDEPGILFECRQYTGEGMHQSFEVCGVENENHFCITANDFNNSVDTLENTFNNCSGNGTSYSCEGTLKTSIEKNNKTEIVKKNNMKCFVEYGNGSFSSIKGKCTNSPMPTIATCQGCSYVYTTTHLTIGTSTIPEDATDDYTTLTERPYFIGLIPNSTTGVIERAFACGIEENTAFCIEGYDVTKWTNGTNQGILNEVFAGKTGWTSSSTAAHYGTNLDAFAYDTGSVDVGYVSGPGTCYVYRTGEAYCVE